MSVYIIVFSRNGEEDMGKIKISDSIVSYLLQAAPSTLP